MTLYVGHPVDGKWRREIAMQIDEMDDQRPKHLHRNGAPKKDEKHILLCPVWSLPFLVGQVKSDHYLISTWMVSHWKLALVTSQKPAGSSLENPARFSLSNCKSCSNLSFKERIFSSVYCLRTTVRNGTVPASNKRPFIILLAKLVMTKIDSETRTRS
uniref:Uncharacterized protein n=1 Tax=Romanomermis culicivorax TaxID=13658 RepID=A0A915IW47_ROMCU